MIMIFKPISSKSISLQREEMLRLYSAEQSRRDVTLLTVEFILRAIGAAHSLKVPQGRYFGGIIVSSLRDIAPLTQHYYKLFIFHP